MVPLLTCRNKSLPIAKNNEFLDLFVKSALLRLVPVRLTTLMTPIQRIQGVEAIPRYFRPVRGWLWLVSRFATDGQLHDLSYQVTLLVRRSRYNNHFYQSFDMKTPHLLNNTPTDRFCSSPHSFGTISRKQHVGGGYQIAIRCVSDTKKETGSRPTTWSLQLESAWLKQGSGSASRPGLLHEPACTVELKSDDRSLNQVP